MIFRIKSDNSNRLLIWKEYIDKAKSSIAYVLFGAPQRGSFWMDLYADNLHNSFFQLHAKYGIIMLIYVVFILAKRSLQYYRRKEMYLLIPMIGMIIRMNTDYTNFNAMLDMLFIYLILEPRYENKRIEVSQNEYSVL